MMMQELIDSLSNFNSVLFHFLRPQWLYAFIPLLWLCVMLWRYDRKASGWQKIVSPVLLPYLLIGEHHHKKRLWPVLVLALTGTIAVLSMAGPTWERLPQPVFRNDAALVIVLDLSRSMDVQDIRPSRLERARFKIRDIVQARQEGQTALIVYAEDAFTVTPLTDDAQTITNQLSALTTGLVPVQGSRADRALHLAGELLRQASQTQGDILLMTDEVSSAPAIEVAQALRQEGYRLSVLGIGTTQGAPVPVRGGVLKDHHGNIVIARLDTSVLQRLASIGGGTYESLTVDDSDIDALGVTEVRTNRQTDYLREDTDHQAEIWKESGPWLLLLVLPLAVLAFRRGVLMVWVVLFFPLSQPVEAFEFDNLWQTPDQQAYQLMQDGKPAEAARQFTDPGWRGSAHYRAGDYHQALEDFSLQEGATGHYNRGNALARMGELQKALESYDKALEINPAHEDAAHNRRLVADALKKKPDAGTASSQQHADERTQAQAEQPSASAQHNTSGAQSDHIAGTPDGSGGGQQQTQQSQRMKHNSPGEQPDHLARVPDGSDEAQQQAQPSQSRQHNAPEEQSAHLAGGADASDGEQQEARMQQNKITDEESLTAVTPQDAYHQKRQMREQWLKRIPDDPAGLLKRKFEYQYKQRASRSTGGKTW